VNVSSIDEDDDRPDRPLYSPKRRRLMRIVVTVAIAAMVLPGVLMIWVTQTQTANYACQIAVAYYAPQAQGSSAKFLITNPEIIGWNCFADFADGSEFFVAHLGLIPGAPRLVPLTGT